MDLSHFYIVPFEIFSFIGFSFVFCGIPAALAVVAFVIYKANRPAPPKEKYYE